MFDFDEHYEYFVIEKSRTTLDETFPPFNNFPGASAMFVRNAFLADHVTIDARGKMSVIGMFDIIWTPKFPAKHRDAILVVNLEGTANEKGTHKISIEFRDDKDDRIGPVIDQAIDLQNPGITHGSLRASVLLKIQDLPFHRAGLYQFVISSDDRFLARISFAVSLLRVEEAGEQ